MPNKSLLQIATAWDSLINLQGIKSTGKHLELVGIILKEFIYSTEKMYIQAISTNKILQLIMKVDLIIFSPLNSRKE